LMNAEENAATKPRRQGRGEAGPVIQSPNPCLSPQILYRKIWQPHREWKIESRLWKILDCGLFSIIDFQDYIVPTGGKFSQSN